MAQHISIRIPWKDNGYSGMVCDKPCYNTACLRLKNIAMEKNDEFEETLAGKPMLGYEMKLPCISEGSTFMSPKSHKRIAAVKIVCEFLYIFRNSLWIFRI